MASDFDKPKMGNYYGTFVIIAAMTLTTVGVSFSSMSGTTRLIISLVIAAVQVLLLSLFFMHLRKSDKLTLLVAGAGLFWLFILFLLLLTDYITRHYAAY